MIMYPVGQIEHCEVPLKRIPVAAAEPNYYTAAAAAAAATTATPAAVTTMTAR